MANTTYLKNEVEQWVRNWLAPQFSNQSFTKENLELVTGGKHEFDAVSGDKSIVAGIKGNSFKTKGGNIPSGKIAELYQELYFLLLVKASRKFLILINEELYKYFTNSSRGKIANEIEIKLCKLPAEMREKVKNIQIQASEEQK